MECWREAEGKRVHDPLYHQFPGKDSYCKLMISTPPTAVTAERCFWVEGPIIIGAGPSGLAVAACLKEKGLPPSVILERSNCIASLWQHKTYDRLCLHLPKHFCELPLMPFPACFPTYPTKQQFLAYLREYARRFDIEPAFNQTVSSAEFDDKIGLWRVRAACSGEKEEEKAGRYYMSRWLVVATGANAESLAPEIDGMREFRGPVVHTSAYRSGKAFRGKKVLVVGCGNSGMEVCLDLCNYNAQTTLVVRDSVHVLPRDMLGTSTFGLSMWLLKWLPVQAVDRFLLLVSRFMLGDTAELGLHRPEIGPLELKSLTGKTPVIDVGTLAKIKSGDIKVRPAIKRLTGHHRVEFSDGRSEDYDAVILATGYKSNVPSWLKEGKFFSEKDGLPRRPPFSNGWKGERGLYAVGFTKGGLLGASIDAKRIAHDIEQCWKADAKQPTVLILPTNNKI